MGTEPRRTDPGRPRYRIEVEGEIRESWTEWFGDVSLETIPGGTILELEVADQAALHGVLRRIHDLRLTLVRIVRLPAHSEPDNEGEHDV